MVKWLLRILHVECAPHLEILWSSHHHPPPHATFKSNSSFTLIIKHTHTVVLIVEKTVCVNMSMHSM